MSASEHLHHAAGRLRRARKRRRGHARPRLRLVVDFGPLGHYQRVFDIHAEVGFVLAYNANATDRGCELMTFAVAWLGTVRSAGLKPDETLVVIGATGGVGSAGIQIGHALGARIIGIDVVQPPAGSAIHCKATWVTVPGREAAPIVRELTGGKGANVVLNAVGNDTFDRPSPYWRMEGACRAGVLTPTATGI